MTNRPLWIDGIILSALGAATSAMCVIDFGVIGRVRGPSVQVFFFIGMILYTLGVILTTMDLLERSQQKPESKDKQ